MRKLYVCVDFCEHCGYNTIHALELDFIDDKRNAFYMQMCLFCYKKEPHGEYFHIKKWKWQDFEKTINN